METKKSTALAATVAAVAAFALIIAATFSGAIFTTTSTSFTTGPTQTSSAQSQTSSQTSSQQSSTQQSSGQQGTLSILLTDPPCVPSGMTKVYVTYADLAVHASGAPNASGWTVMRASGSIELLGTVNISQTISSVKVSTGTYNMIRFNVTGAEVTYYGKNYTAFVQTSELTIPIVSGISVVASTPSATIIDISPTVINTGTQAIPQFIITSAADAYPVPSAAVTVQQQQEGSQMSLTGLSWWQTIAQASTAHLSVVSASLNQTYLNLKVTNTGGSSTVLNLVTVTTLANATAAGNSGVLPTALGQSAIFVVLSNGTLVQLYMSPVQTSASIVSASLFSARGLQLPPGATATLTHSHGTIIMGFMGVVMMTLVSGIVKGQQYLVTVIGEQTAASIVVTAT